MSQEVVDRRSRRNRSTALRTDSGFNRLNMPEKIDNVVKENGNERYNAYFTQCASELQG